MTKYKYTTVEQLENASREENARNRWQGALRALPSWQGGRNGSLLWLVSLGRAAGLDDAAIYDALMSNCGTPPLTHNEVTRAIRNAKGLPENAAPNHGEEPLGTHFIKCVPEERGFVAQMKASGRGTTVEGLQRATGLMPTEQCPHEAMVRQMKAMCDFRGDISATRFDLFASRFWVGKSKSEGELLPPFNIIMNGVPGEVPNFVTCNALTGEAAPTKDGQGMTLRGDNCVVAPWLMLVEFDAMPREEQLAFIGGVIKTGTLKVVSVVDSGNRSFHALVEVEGEYAAFREKMLRLCCSSEDPRERIDRAVLHPSALTRLAGAVRPDTGNVQELVWCHA